MNPFEKFTQSELEALEPILRMLNAYYAMDGLILDFKSVYKNPTDSSGQTSKEAKE